MDIVMALCARRLVVSRRQRKRLVMALCARRLVVSRRQRKRPATLDVATEALILAHQTELRTELLVRVAGQASTFPVDQRRRDFAYARRLAVALENRQDA